MLNWIHWLDAGWNFGHRYLGGAFRSEGEFMNAVGKQIFRIGFGCFLILAIAHFVLDVSESHEAGDYDSKMSESPPLHQPSVRSADRYIPGESASLKERIPIESLLESENQDKEFGSLLISIAGKIEDGSRLRVFSYGRKPRPLGAPSVEPLLVEELRPGTYYVEAKCPHGERTKTRTEVSGSTVLDVELELSLCVSAAPIKLADLTIELEWPENWEQMADGFSFLGLNMQLKPVGRNTRSSRRWIESLPMETGTWGRHIWELERIPLDDYELEIDGLGVTFEISTERLLSGYFHARIEAPLTVTCSFHLSDEPNTQVIPKQIVVKRGGAAFSSKPNDDGLFLLHLPKGCAFQLELSAQDWGLVQEDRGERFEAIREGQHLSIPLLKRCGVHFSGESIDEYFGELTFEGPGEYVGQSRLFRPEQHLYAKLSEPGHYLILRDSIIVARVDVAPGEFPDVTIER